VLVHTCIPNNGVEVLVQYCTGAVYIKNATPQPSTDAQGNYTFTFTGQKGSGSSTITIYTRSGASMRLTWPCG
jgi:hypothetical protein